MNRGFYLTLMMGSSNASPVPQPVIDALTTVQVTVASGQRSGFQLTFAAGLQSPLNRSLLPAGYFDPTTRVIIVVTVNGMPSVLMDGVITRQDLAPSNQIGKSTLTVTGEDLTCMMDLTDSSGTSFQDMSAEDRVATLIGHYGSYGITPSVVPSAFMVTPVETDWIPQQQGTDLDYINTLARDVGYVFYLEPGPAPGTSVAYWGPEVKTGVPQPALNVNMDAQTNVESLTMGFDGFSKTQYTMNVLIDGQITTVPVPDITPINPLLGAKPIPSIRVEPLTEAGSLTTAQAAAMGQARASESADVISGSGQLDVLRYGRPLRARGLVGVRGAGITYDGLYYVKSVTHNIQRGEYKQSFSLSRNALLSMTSAVPV